MLSKLLNRLIHIIARTDIDGSETLVSLFTIWLGINLFISDNLFSHIVICYSSSIAIMIVGFLSILGILLQNKRIRRSCTFCEVFLWWTIMFYGIHVPAVWGLCLIVSLTAMWSYIRVTRGTGCGI